MTQNVCLHGSVLFGLCRFCQTPSLRGSRPWALGRNQAPAEGTTSGSDKGDWILQGSAISERTSHSVSSTTRFRQEKSTREALEAKQVKDNASIHGAAQDLGELPAHSWHRCLRLQH